MSHRPGLRVNGLALLPLALLLTALASASAHAQTPAAAPTPTQPSTPPAPAANDGVERLLVADPYLEMHTGPGRGYPVFFVAERDAWIQIELRHTDWYKVSTAGGKTGWVHRSQLKRTLTAAGGQKSFRDTLVDDYLLRRVELGAAWGQFKREPMLKVWTSYRLSDTLSLEGTLGQVQGLFSGTDYWHLNLHVEPWSNQRFSPYASVGFGNFRNIPNSSLVGASTTNAKLANGVIGARFYLSQRVMVRADYSILTAFVADTRSSEYRAATIGLSFFF